MGIPGPVFDNKVDIIANLVWKDINGEEIAKTFNFKKMILLNDFVCNG